MCSLQNKSVILSEFLIEKGANAHLIDKEKKQRFTMR
jgi:hypothetical protein